MRADTCQTEEMEKKKTLLSQQKTVSIDNSQTITHGAYASAQTPAISHGGRRDTSQVRRLGTAQIKKADVSAAVAVTAA